MKHWYLISLILLCACSKEHSLIGVGAIPMRSDTIVSTAIPVIVVMGQSNAVGLGQDSPTHMDPSIIYRGLDFPRGIGPAFAQAYEKQLSVKQVILVQCSVGGTGIDEWQSGTPLYNQCQHVLHDVSKEFPKSSPAVLLFWQGEKDAQTLTVPWAQEFTNMVHSFRTDIAKFSLPIVFCQIDTDQFFNQAYLYPGWDYIKQQQASVNIPGVVMVRTDDILDLTDSLHVSRSGLDIIGQRMFTAYKDTI